MPELTIGNIALIPIIVGIIELLKAGITVGDRHYALPAHYAPLANAILVTLAYALTVYVQAEPELAPSLVVILQGIIVFLSAAGFYHVAVKPFRRG